MVLAVSWDTALAESSSSNRIFLVSGGPGSTCTMSYMVLRISVLISDHRSFWLDNWDWKLEIGNCSREQYIQLGQSVSPNQEKNHAFFAYFQLCLPNGNTKSCKLVKRHNLSQWRMPKMTRLVQVKLYNLLENVLLALDQNAPKNDIILRWLSCWHYDTLDEQKFLSLTIELTEGLLLQVEVQLILYRDDRNSEQQPFPLRRQLHSLPNDLWLHLLVDGDTWSGQVFKCWWSSRGVENCGDKTSWEIIWSLTHTEMS